jgi:hypothetical protein
LLAQGALLGHRFFSNDNQFINSRSSMKPGYNGLMKEKRKTTSVKLDAFVPRIVALVLLAVLLIVALAGK